jgi:hypothetical protein
VTPGENNGTGDFFFISVVNDNGDFLSAIWLNFNVTRGEDRCDNIWKRWGILMDRR